MKPLVVIPARGGSKGVPKKNIKPLAGRPLICYTLDAARAVFSDEIILVSTDSLEIKNVVEKEGLKVPFLRPPHLASDYAGMYEVILHAIDYSENQYNYFPEIVILLQPTSPFRKGFHIKEAMNLFSTVFPNIDLLVSVKETKSNPYYTLFEENEQGYLVKSKNQNFRRRQDCPKVYELNGAIYVSSTEAIRKSNFNGMSKISKYEMDEISSLDIDTDFDFLIASLLMSHLKLNIGKGNSNSSR